tara:strand:- start:210 stop:437 length:228 start_codon:yes stop_codon:yes gene_type:complete
LANPSPKGQQPLHLGLRFKNKINDEEGTTQDLLIPEIQEITIIQGVEYLKDQMRQHALETLGRVVLNGPEAILLN